MVPCLMFVSKFVGYRFIRSRARSLMGQKMLTQTLLCCLSLTFCLLTAENEAISLSFDYYPDFFFNHILLSAFLRHACCISGLCYSPGVSPVGRAEWLSIYFFPILQSQSVFCSCVCPALVQ